MSVIAEFSVPASEFVLGKALRESPSLTVEIDTMVPVESGTIPFFWVIGEERAGFDAVLEREPELDDFSVVDTLDTRALYRARWNRSVDTLVRAMTDHDAVLQEASGDDDSWQFQLRFPDSHTLSAFHTACRDVGVSLRVERLYDPIEPRVMDTRELTESQRDLIVRAYDEGYFDVPRKITLMELAEKLGISDQAVNERLRRGLSSLIGSTLESGQE